MVYTKCKLLTSDTLVSGDPGTALQHVHGRSQEICSHFLYPIIEFKGNNLVATTTVLD